MAEVSEGVVPIKYQLTLEDTTSTNLQEMIEKAREAKRQIAAVKEVEQDIKNMTVSMKSMQTQISDFRRSMSVITMGVRGVNAARLAVEQVSRAITKADPRAAMYAFLNIVQVIRNLTSFLTLYQTQVLATAKAQAIMAATSGGAAVAQEILAAATWKSNIAQGVLNVLLGRWYLVAAALVAAGVLWSMMQRSMEAGGSIKETGWYYLHKGEEVLPATTVNRISNVTYGSSIINRYGPFNLTVSERPRDMDEYFRRWSRTEARRSEGVGV